MKGEMYLTTAVPKKKRIADPKAIEEARKNFCQCCGRYSEKGLHVHHVKTRGAGGDDVAENEVTLCYECHMKVHSGLLKLENIVVIELPPLETVIQLCIDSIQDEEDAVWRLAAGIVVLREGLKMKIGQISEAIGKSPAEIRVLRDTFLAFPQEEMRVPDKSFTHHRYAAKTDNPVEWLNKAVEEDWSTRQLDKEIKRSKCISEKAREGMSRSRAEKALRELKEAASDPAASKWLLDELKKIFRELLAAA